MAYLCRVKNSKIKALSNHLKRCYFHSHGPNYRITSGSHTSVRVLSSPSLIIPKIPLEFPKGVRFFAAPIQVKTRKEEKDTSGPRLNQEITAQVIRLVLDDEGHRVVSLHEALELARRDKLDLVEVARNAKPPVCKLMDYHKEKYQQQLKETAKSKSKSEVTLRKGDCKEVRFVGKIEQKDLKIKADTIKRMMERGYRVKCTAMSMGNEGEDLGAVLSRLSSLIEDVAFVESGPRVEKKQAYVVVRHVKFGPTKKGSGKKASKETMTANLKEAAASPQSSVQLNQNSDAEDSSIESDDDGCLEEMTDEVVDDFKSDWSVSGANGGSDKVFEFVEGEMMGAKTLGSAKVSSDFARPVSVHDSSRTGPAVSLSGGQNGFRRDLGNTSQAQAGEENRYRREPRSPFIPNDSLPISSPGLRGSPRVNTQPDLGRQPPPDVNRFSPTRDLGSQFPRKFPVNGSPQQYPSHASVRSPPATGFGIFSSPQAGDTSSKENNIATEVNRYKKGDQFNAGRTYSGSDPRGLPNSNAQARRPDLAKRDGQKEYRDI